MVLKALRLLAVPFIALAIGAAFGFWSMLEMWREVWNQ
jgi:hypothetical protein